MTAKDKSRALSAHLAHRAGILITTSDADTLRRAEMTLHRWAEHECNGTIQRDETTGTPYRYTNDGRRCGIAPDREAGALRRVKEVCERLGVAFYHQTDPRGCALYVAHPDAGMTDRNHSSVGAACCEVTP